MLLGGGVDLARGEEEDTHAAPRVRELWLERQRLPVVLQRLFN